MPTPTCRSSVRRWRRPRPASARVSVRSGGSIGAAARELFEETGILLGVPPPLLGDPETARREVETGRLDFARTAARRRGGHRRRRAASVGALGNSAWRGAALRHPVLPRRRCRPASMRVTSPRRPRAAAWVGVRLRAGRRRAWHTQADAADGGDTNLAGQLRHRRRSDCGGRAPRPDAGVANPARHRRGRRGRPARRHHFYPAEIDPSMTGASHPAYETPRLVTPLATVVLAENPDPMTLEGTNTWLLRAAGTDAAVVVDPGPDDPRHLDAVIAAAGEVQSILLTHGHPDHSAGARALHERTGAPVRALDPAHRLGGEGLDGRSGHRCGRCRSAGVVYPRAHRRLAVVPAHGARRLRPGGAHRRHGARPRHHGGRLPRRQPRRLPRFVATAAGTRRLDSASRTRAGTAGRRRAPRRATSPTASSG